MDLQPRCPLAAAVFDVGRWSLTSFNGGIRLGLGAAEYDISGSPDRIPWRLEALDDRGTDKVSDVICATGVFCPLDNGGSGIERLGFSFTAILAAVKFTTGSWQSFALDLVDFFQGAFSIDDIREEAL